MADESNVKTNNSGNNSSNSVIKTRETTRNIKVLNKAAIISDRTRNAYVRTRNEADNLVVSNDDNATNYAEDKAMETSRNAAAEGAHQIKKQGKKAKDRIEQRIEKQLNKRHEKQLNNDSVSNRTMAQKKSVAKQTSAKSSTKVSGGKNTSIKTLDSGTKTIKTTARSGIKTTAKTAKTAERSIKTAEKTAKTAVKTAEKTAQTAKKTAETTAKASEKAMTAAYKAAVATGKAVVAATKAIVAAAKSAASAATKIITAIVAALGSAGPFIALALVFVLVSCLLTGDSVQNSDNDMTNAEIISDINDEWQRQLDWINTDSYENVIIQGSRASWVDVYSVFTALAADEVDNGNWERRDWISKVFWDMHSITYTKEISIAGETAVQLPITITLQTGEVTFLYINNGAVNRQTEITYQNEADIKDLLEQYKDREISMVLTLEIHTKTIDEMADYYNFSDWQRDEAKSLTEDDFKEYWMERIYGIYGADTDIVNVALTQVGNTGGYPYWAYTGYSSRVEWCACFVSWCAGQCGYVDQGLFPNTASPPYQAQYFRSEGHWLDGSATPSPGMIIFFDWYNADFADHVGIVEKVEDGYVYTIEGNSSDSVRQNTWTVGDGRIMGYGWIVE